jgi:hypothetical protein
VDALARAVVADWYALGDELLLRFGDGFEHAADGSGAWGSTPLAYPADWLESVGFYRATSDRPPPPTVEWTAERKRALRNSRAEAGGAK